jgi:hypothetical protein
MSNRRNRRIVLLAWVIAVLALALCVGILVNPDSDNKIVAVLGTLALAVTAGALTVRLRDKS